MGLVLLTGGVRCGKSRLAVQLAEDCGREVVFIATGRETDPDMAARIHAHRDGRPPGWRTIEEQVAVADQVQAAPAESCLVVDCLGLWVANLMLADMPEPEVMAEAQRLAAALSGRPSAIVVTNEVGMGVHPQTPAGRAFRDQLGRVNSIMAAAAGDAYLVVAGRLLPLLEPASAFAAAARE